MELVDRSALPGERVLDGAVEEGTGERVVDRRRRAGGEEVVPELAADRTVNDEVPGILVGDQPFPDPFCRRRGEALEPLPLDGDKDGSIDISDVGERGRLPLRKGREDERIPLRCLLAQAVPRGRGSRVAVLRGERREGLGAPRATAAGSTITSGCSRRTRGRFHSLAAVGSCTSLVRMVTNVSFPAAFRRWRK
jgi:hypothetical protein